MEITVSQTDEKYLIIIPDTLDVLASPHLKNILDEVVPAADDIELDFSKTGLVTSAGPRVLIQAQKKVQALGKKMTLINMSPDVLEVFNITGLTKVFVII